MPKDIQVWLSKEEILALNRSVLFSHITANSKSQSDFWIKLSWKLKKALDKQKDSV